MFIKGVLICGLSLLFIRCQPDTDTIDEMESTPLSVGEVLNRFFSIDVEALENYASPELPDYYHANRVVDMDQEADDNPITDMGATLGRILFYDKTLSINQSISCATCHSQLTGFTDASRFSEGFDGELTGTHSMRLANARYFESGRMFWDKRANTLEEQTTQPIRDGTEMGFTDEVGGMEVLLERLKNGPYYPILFEANFEDGEITEKNMQRALAQFIRSMVSSQSRFDEGFESVYNGNDNTILLDFPNFTDAENRGKHLYMTNPNNGGAGCQRCHGAPTFALLDNAQGNGLDRGETTVFKSPSLKNVALVGPYMHDGRFETLAQVIEHYNSGIRTGPALDNRLMNRAGPERLNLSQQEKDDLLAFLRTLDDEAFVQEKKFSDPF